MIIQKALRSGDWRLVHSGGQLKVERTESGVVVVCYGVDIKTGDSTAVRLLLTKNESALIGGNA